MLCPKCNNPMHQSSIGLLVCLKCGYSHQPEEPTQFTHNEEPAAKAVASLAPAEPHEVDSAQAYQSNSEDSEIPERLTINDFVVDEPPKKRRFADLAIVKNISNLDAKQKKILLASFVSVFIFSVVGSFLTFQDYQASSLLKQGMALNQSSQFELAATSLDKAKNHIKFPSTKKAIDKEVANNTRWQEFQKMQLQAEAFMSEQKFSEALDLLYQISDDYPAYKSVQKDIALAQSKQSSVDDLAVLSDEERVDELGLDDGGGSVEIGFEGSSFDDNGGYDGGGSAEIGYDGGGGDYPSNPNPVTPPPVLPPVLPPAVKTNPIIRGPCQFDAKLAMDLYYTAVALADFCQANYYRIETILKIQSPYVVPHKIAFGDDSNASHTSQNTVYLRPSYIRSNPNNRMVLTHNLAHIAQAYKSASVWNTEGIADYAAIEIIEGAAGYYCPAGTKINTSSRCGASFLKWARIKYASTNFWSALQNQLRDGSYSDTGFWDTAKTGNKTLRENYALCRNTSYCKGGIAW